MNRRGDLMWLVDPWPDLAGQPDIILLAPHLPGPGGIETRWMDFLDAARKGLNEELRRLEGMVWDDQVDAEYWRLFSLENGLAISQSEAEIELPEQQGEGPPYSFSAN